jgi:phenylalanyl-tRNA synthetase beta chain
MKISRNWLQKYFDVPLPEVSVLEDALTFHAFEIDESYQSGDDSIMDVKVLPNRAADCLSHRGIAKELSAILDIPLTEDPFRKTLTQVSESKILSISVEDPKLCDRYIGAVIQNVHVGPSPEWLQKALESIGARSINNVVDATNYVMLDLGQPLHAFDAANLSKKDGKYHINVRSAAEGEKVTTLSREEYTLTSDRLLIADGNANEALGIAGVKGGKAAKITEETKDIIIESAHFNYASIRKTAQRLKLFTDASLRFQNDPSPELAAYGMDAVVALILHIAGGELEGVVDVGDTPAPHAPVSISG